MPEQARPPTSHEWSSGRDWDASYCDGAPAPWDIGRPQKAFVRVATEHGFAGPALDAGCGTGEHALLAASLGVRVMGVDLAETAIDRARAKAADQGLDAEFQVADAFELDRLGRTFATVLDCGLFHTFDDDERARYVASLASVTDRDGTLYLLCFSDLAPAIGPHPIRQEELRAGFDSRNGWSVVAIDPDLIQTTFMQDGVPAWFATIRRL
ncbi:MAG TPA: class I SAM-dependent methyltransferase [Acidimicrobiales bacterium]